MKLKIRFAKPTDFKNCKSFDSQITASQFAYKAKGKEIILALQNTTVVGYLRLEFLWLKIPYISWIMVSSKNRNQGVAASLVDFLKTELKKKHFPFILSSYQNNALQSKRWHTKLGFRSCGKISSINEDGSAEMYCQLKL